MARGYYGTKLSEHLSKSPEGYLIALSVPIARIGYQQYQGNEIGLDDSKTYNVYRDASEVFAAECIASFEGKSVTDGHPPEWVTPTNENSYHKGHVQNVKRGAGEDEDKIIADVFIKEANLINKVENGLREISCGYNCDYVPIEGKDEFWQTKIRGNHIAVVETGRAGSDVAIRDSIESNNNTGGNTMSLKELLGLGIKEASKTADAKAMASMLEEVKTLDAKDDDDDDKKAKDALDWKVTTDALANDIKSIKDTLDKLMADWGPGCKEGKEEKDALDKLEEELEGKATDDDDDDDKKAKDADDDKGKDAGVITTAPTLGEGEKESNPIPGADKKTVLDAIKTMRPVIAQIKDPVERKKAVDSLAKAFRTHVAPGTQKASYGDLLKLKRTTDTKVDDEKAFGQSIKDKYHRKPLQN
jgi:hypothetical protein